MADNRAEEKPEVHPALKTSQTHANLTLSVTRPSERLTTRFDPYETAGAMARSSQLPMSYQISASLTPAPAAG